MAKDYLNRKERIKEFWNIKKKEQKEYKYEQKDFSFSLEFSKLCLTVETLIMLSAVNRGKKLRME